MNLYNKIWNWWKLRRGYNWCEYKCGCIAIEKSMTKSCPLCGCKIVKFHKKKHEIQIWQENWEGV